MALDTIAKMVKAAGPPQIQPHLADLSVTMLESLSGMEVRLIFADGGFSLGGGGGRGGEEGEGEGGDVRRHGGVACECHHTPLYIGLTKLHHWTMHS